VLGPLLGRLQPRRRSAPKPLGEYYGKIIGYALRTRWGARPMSRFAAAREAGVALDHASVGAGASGCGPEATGTRAG